MATNPFAGTSQQIGLLNTPAKTKVTTTLLPVTKVFDAKPKPGDLAVGQVGEYTVNGKTTYIVGNVGGKLTNPTTSISTLNSKINDVAIKAEKVQIDNLKDENTIEITEIKNTLKAEGASTKEIKAAVAIETAANEAEVKTAQGLLSPAGFQALQKNTAGLLAVVKTDNTKGFNIPINFNTSTVTNADGTKSTTWNSLSYSGANADAVMQNINTTLDQVSELKTKYGLTSDTPSTSSSEGTTIAFGLPDSKLYDAISSGAITKNDAGGFTANADMFGIKEGSSSADKGFAYNVTAILDRDTIVGGKVKGTIDTDGNVKVEGMGIPLVNSGQKDSTGRAIFTQQAKTDEKYVDTAVTSVYVQEADGSYTYMGSPSPSYVHYGANGFDLASFVLKAGLSIAAYSFGMPFIANNVIAPLLEGTTLAGNAVAANAIAGSLVGGAVGAATGAGALEGALTGGIGAAAGTVLARLADQYGGWTSLANAAYTDIGEVTQAAKAIATGTSSVANIQLGVDAAGNVVDAATNTAFTGEGVQNIDINTPLLPEGIDLTTGAGGTAFNQSLNLPPDLSGLLTTTPPATAGDLLGAGMPQVEAVANAVDYNLPPVPPQGINIGINQAGDSVNLDTGLPFQPPGINLATDTAGNIVDAATMQPFQSPEIMLPQVPITPQPPTMPPTVQDTGLLNSVTQVGGDVVNLIKENPWTATAVAAGAAGGLLTPPQAPEGAKWTPFPATTINYGNMATAVPQAMPNWWQNLYTRGGAGAGEYLGYDILRNMNIPVDVKGLLGYGQNTASTTPA